MDQTAHPAPTRSLWTPGEGAPIGTPLPPGLDGRTVTLTGGLGVVGLAILELLLRDSTCRILLPVRAQDDEHARRRARGELRHAIAGLTEAELARVEAVAADLGEPSWGLEPTIFGDLARGTDYLIHSAGDTNLAASRETAWTNVTMSETVLDFAKAAPSLVQAVNIGTAYQLGEGVISSHPRLYEDARCRGWTTGYTESKAAAGELWRGWKGPWVEARPSIIAGNWADGFTPKFDVFYILGQLMAEGLLPFVRAVANGRCDVVCRDYVAAWTVHLLLNPAARGKIVHLTAGDRSPTIGSFMSAMAGALGVAPPEFCAPGTDLGPLLRASTDDPERQRTLLGVAKMIGTFEKFGLSNGVFDTGRRDELLGDRAEALAPPQITTSMPALMALARAAGFGEGPARKNPKSRSECWQLLREL